ncbi:MAG: hypothetical protein ISS79_10000 [Phycisphaerae bacterium]|nr:hypothetical protein [Phycisphaerae bacterium]
MKKTLLFLVVALFLAGTPAWADMTYLVELGTPASEVLYGINAKPNATLPSPVPAGWADWGSYVGPTTGGYGGISTDPLSNDNICRMVWGGGGGAYDEYNWAEIVFPENIHTARIRHLDGSGDDSFDVHVDGNLWGHYTAGLSGEQWTLSTYSGTPGTTLRITVTEDSWSGFATYGQLGIDRVEAVPVPGAFVLGAIGLSLAKWRLRRRETL